MIEKTHVKQTSKVRRNLSENLRPDTRLQRMRQKAALRDLLAETKIGLDDLVCPILLSENNSPNNTPFLRPVSLENLQAEVQQVKDLALKAIFLQRATNYGFNFSMLERAVSIVKRIAPELLLIAEVSCLDFYNRPTDIKNTLSYHDNDHALLILSEQAVKLAQAGVDIIMPDEMHDGVVSSIRSLLNRSGFADTLIMGQGVKYNSCFNFNATVSGETNLDTASYRMDPANAQMSMRAIETVINEDADIIMLQPAQNYLDVLRRAKEEFSEVSIGAFHGVSDVAMITAAAERGWINKREAIIETLLSIKRAGASFIITYFAKSMAEYLQ